MTRDEAIALAETLNWAPEPGETSIAARHIVRMLEALSLLKFEKPVRKPVPNRGPVEIDDLVCSMLITALRRPDHVMRLREDLALAGIALVRVEPCGTPLRYNE